MAARVIAKPAPAWLAASPIAHRGLHDLTNGVVENSPRAAQAAIDRGFAIECDVQLTADGEAVVFHDFSLDRLTAASGTVLARSARELTGLRYRSGSDQIATLAEFLDLIGGRVPLICEIKSRFDGDLRLAGRVAALASAYHGPIAVKSFDPVVIAHLRTAPPCPLGMVASRLRRP